MPAQPADSRWTPVPRAASTPGSSWLLLQVIVLLLAIGVSGTFAQSRQNDTPAQRFLKQADTDGDGRLSPEERQAARERFRTFRQQQNENRDALSRGENPGVIPATIDAADTRLYKAQPGHFPGDDRPTPIAISAQITLPGAGDERDIPLRVTVRRAPNNALVDPAPYPVVIFCHGALGSKDDYLALTEFWASHGYAVIQPTFGDSLSLISPVDRQNITSIGQLLTSDHVRSQWNKRPRDVARIIDQLETIEKRTWEAMPNTAMMSTFDREKIAVAGHSYGAHTTMLLTGAAPRVAGAAQPLLKNPALIKAGIALSPQGTSPTFKAEQFSRFSVPMLFVTGDNDGSPMPGQLDKKGDWRREAYDHSPEGDRYLLWIDDAHHNLGGISGANLPGAGPGSPDQVLLVQSTTLAFLDAYLRNNDDAKKYLASDTIRDASNDIAHLEKKLNNRQ